jgi:predicted membrane protein
MDAAPFTGYVYPNEAVIQWSVLIVIYPYLTGLVAGAFTVSSFYHVFGMQRFAVARLAAASLCVLIFVPVPLLMHLGHPERSIYSMITPHLTSAFAMFGFFAAFYMVLLILECWFVYRKDNVLRANSSNGLKRSFYRAVTSGPTTSHRGPVDRREHAADSGHCRHSFRAWPARLYRLRVWILKARLCGSRT